MKYFRNRQPIALTPEILQDQNHLRMVLMDAAWKELFWGQRGWQWAIVELWEWLRGLEE